VTLTNYLHNSVSKHLLEVIGKLKMNASRKHLIIFNLFVLNSSIFMTNKMNKFVNRERWFAITKTRTDYNTLHSEP